MRFPGQPPPSQSFGSSSGGGSLATLLRLMQQQQASPLPPLGGGASGGLAHPDVIRRILQNGFRPLTPSRNMPFENFPPGWNDMGMTVGQPQQITPNPNFLRRRRVGPMPF